MRLRKLLLVAAGAAAVFGLQLRTPAFAADETVSPCCAKVCNPTTGTSVACKPALLGGIGTNDLLGNVGLVRGCVDVETAPPGSICYGGAIVDSGAPALINGCLCVLGDAGSASGAGMCVRVELSPNLGETLTPEQCTLLSVAQCGQNVITTANDPACSTCPAPPTCGDGTCDASIGENCATCAADCGCTGTDTCQNGTCAPPPPSCGDGTCNNGETCTTCAQDCGACPPSCGDGTCNGSETCTTCAQDCGACPPTCGDGTCNGSETCSSCPGDCGACPPVCGDGSCDASAGEDCSTCAADCGVCQCQVENQVCQTGAHAKLVCCSGLQCVDNSSGQKHCSVR